MSRFFPGSSIVFSRVSCFGIFLEYAKYRASKLTIIHSSIIKIRKVARCKKKVIVVAAGTKKAELGGTNFVNDLKKI